MNTKLLATGRRLFANEIAPRSTVRHNIRAWARSVHALGDNWVYGKTYAAGTLPQGQHRGWKQ